MGEARFDFDFAALAPGSWQGHLVDSQARVAVNGDALYSFGSDSLSGGGGFSDFLADATDSAEPLLLGRTSDGLVHLAWGVEQRPGVQFKRLIQVADRLSGDESLLGAQAVALARWHDQNRFCTRCGGRVRPSEAGWANECTGCGVTEYPRTDPVVIVRILDGQDRLLLAHNTAWEPGRVSLLAGFVEAGESPRRAVQREVFEEVGVRVCEARYLGSQYWPGPRSLMLAFEARSADANPEVVADEQEIAWAKFFSRQELGRALTQGEVRGPDPSSIAAVAISQWLGRDIQELMAKATEAEVPETGGPEAGVPEASVPEATVSEA